jgi:hypothetical protein
MWRNDRDCVREIEEEILDNGPAKRHVQIPLKARGKLAKKLKFGN